MAADYFFTSHVSLHPDTVPLTNSPKKQAFISFVRTIYDQWLGENYSMHNKMTPALVLNYSYWENQVRRI